jgi:nitrite reductase/ring-hydroxylating ferredoxin subunit
VKIRVIRGEKFAEGKPKMDSNKKYTWHKIAESIDEINFSANGLATVNVNNKTICIALHKNQLFACTHKCPHAGGSMADGHIDALGNIVCPLHRYKFSLQNGRNTSGEGYYLKTFKVETKDNGIFVGLEENNLFGLLK